MVVSSVFAACKLLSPPPSLSHPCPSHPFSPRHQTLENIPTPTHVHHLTRNLPPSFSSSSITWSLTAGHNGLIYLLSSTHYSVSHVMFITIAIWKSWCGVLLSFGLDLRLFAWSESDPNPGSQDNPVLFFLTRHKSVPNPLKKNSVSCYGKREAALFLDAFHRSISSQSVQLVTWTTA